MIDAKGYLLRLKKLDKIINNKLIEKVQWEALATSTTSRLSPDKVQSSGSQSKMADAVIKYVDLENEINKLIDSYIKAKTEAIAMIEKLNAVEYDVLHKFYIQGKDFYSIADDYERTYSWATSKHGTALKNLQKILEENNF